MTITQGIQALRAHFGPGKFVSIGSHTRWHTSDARPVTDYTAYADQMPNAQGPTVAAAVNALIENKRQDADEALEGMEE